MDGKSAISWQLATNFPPIRREMVVSGGSWMAPLHRSWKKRDDPRSTRGPKPGEVRGWGLQCPPPSFSCSLPGSALACIIGRQPRGQTMHEACAKHYENHYLRHFCTFELGICWPCSSVTPPWITATVISYLDSHQGHPLHQCQSDSSKIQAWLCPHHWLD